MSRGSVRKFAGFNSRSKARVANNLGIIPKTTAQIIKTFRDPELDKLDAYYESRQYHGMPEWDSTKDDAGDYIAVRKRQPKMNFAFAKVLTSRVASKLVGKKNFPTFKIEEDEDTTELLRMVIQSSGIRAKIIEPLRRCLNTGSAFVRFMIVDGTWKIEHYLSKWCFPEFDDTGKLEKIEIKYVYDDKEDTDDEGVPKKKWFRLVLTGSKDIMYNNPEFSSEEEPEWVEEDVVEHNLGFVQGEWLSTSDETDQIDGNSLIVDILDFIDEINYSMSQSSDSVAYNQDPQLVLNNMDEDEISQLIRSSQKAWNLGRDGKAELLEASMSGPEMAVIFRDKVKLGIQDIARIVMMDPEKVVGHAQSAKALEVLHGPMVELIEELQPQFEKNMKSLLSKMTLALLVANGKSMQVPIVIPPGYKIISLNIIASFPPVFAQTMQDLREKVSVAVQAASGNLISRESMTKWLAKDFDIEDIEEELARIENQPIINPFSSF